MGCKVRSIRADASRRKTGSGRGAGRSVVFRSVGETNGIRMIRTRIEWLAELFNPSRAGSGRGVDRSVVFRSVSSTEGTRMSCGSDIPTFSGGGLAVTGVWLEWHAQTVTRTPPRRLRACPSPGWTCAAAAVAARCFIRTPIEWAAKPVQSERGEWEQHGFRTWSRQSGEVPDCWRNKRNPYQRSVRVVTTCLAAAPATSLV